MSKWDKTVERLFDLIKSSDDTPTEQQSRLYDLTVGVLIDVGNKLQAENKELRFIVDGKNKALLARIEVIEKHYEKLEAIRHILLAVRNRYTISNVVPEDSPYKKYLDDMIQELWKVLGE